MKLSRIVPVLVLGLGLLISTTSCVVTERGHGHGRHDNGKHKGWYKSSNKSHHSNSNKTYNSNKHYNKKGKGRK